jgi:hypothetical protein
LESGRGRISERKPHTETCLKPEVIQQEVAEVCFARGLSNWEIGKGKLCNFTPYSAAICKFQKTHPFNETFNITTQSLTSFKV